MAQLITAREMITPAKAEKYLGHMHERQRHHHERLIAIMAKDMLNDRWHDSHQGIAFDLDGKLVDGGKRMRSIVEAARLDPEFKGVSMLVTRNLPREAFGIFDIGSPRITSQLMGMLHGLSFTNHMVAIGTRMLSSTQEYYRKSKPELMDLLKEHSEAIDFAKIDHAQRGLQSGPVAAVVARAWYTQDHGRLLQFKAVFASGFTDLDSEYAAIAMRNYCLQNKSSGSAERLQTYMKAQNAVRAFLLGRSIKQVVTSTEEYFGMPGEEIETKIYTLPKSRRLAEESVQIAKRNGVAARATPVRQ